MVIGCVVVVDVYVFGVVDIVIGVWIVFFWVVGGVGGIVFGGIS